MTSSASSTPSTSTSSSSVGGVTLYAIMAQLQRMDAQLDALSDELCQVFTRVNRILSGFMASPSPSLEASEDEEIDGDTDSDDADEDGDASSSSDDEMTT